MERKIWPRSSGILLHVSSLPGVWPVGDFGSGSSSYINFLRHSGHSWWQVLPLNPIGSNPSPYSTISSFALEPLYIDLDVFFEHGLLNRNSDMIPGLNKVFEGKADFKAARKLKYPLYERACLRWLSRKDYKSEEFAEFCEREKHWLDDFAMFCAVSEYFNSYHWPTWPHGIRTRQAAAMSYFQNELADRILYFGFLQFFAYQSWYGLRGRCQQESIRVLGDLPIYQGLDSCDVWAHRANFQVSESGVSQKVSGVPPDAFNAAGQKWGHPLLDWQFMQEDNFSWLRSRIDHQLRLYDTVRLDHFIGYYRHWEVDTKDQDARYGSWQSSLGEGLLTSLKNELKSLPMIAEDLGAVVPEVHQLRQKLQLPGMKVIQFGFGPAADPGHLPHNFDQHCVAYSGTHDNETLRGWFNGLKEVDSDTAKKCLSYFQATESNLTEAIINHLYCSVAHTIIVPMQDILDLDNRARLNIPGKVDCKWNWRLKELNFDPYIDQFAQYVKLYDREPM